MCWREASWRDGVARTARLGSGRDPGAGAMPARTLTVPNAATARHRHVAACHGIMRPARNPYQSRTAGPDAAGKIDAKGSAIIDDPVSDLAAETVGGIAWAGPGINRDAPGAVVFGGRTNVGGLRQR